MCLLSCFWTANMLEWMSPLPVGKGPVGVSHHSRRKTIWGKNGRSQGKSPHLFSDTLVVAVAFIREVWSTDWQEFQYMQMKCSNNIHEIRSSLSIRLLKETGCGVEICSPIPLFNHDNWFVKGELNPVQQIDLFWSVEEKKVLKIEWPLSLLFFALPNLVLLLRNKCHL